MPALISVDFGNSYTKVGIRLNRNAESELITDGSLFDQYDLKFCIPTLVARVNGGGKEQWYYGTDVIQKVPKTAANKHIYRNWKPAFFEGVEQRLPGGTAVLATTGTETASDDRRQIPETDAQTFASQYGIPIERLQEFLRDYGVKIATQRANADNATDGWDTEFQQNIGVGFFTWLRQFIEPVCRKKGLPDVGSIPVRISLPSFGSHTRAEQLLIDILQQSGWKPADRFPALAEPVSNSIGIFTAGRNATWFPPREGGREFPHNGKMFRDAGVFQALREYLLNRGPQFYWALGIDVGGYTADFAMLGFDLDEMESVHFDGEHDGMRRLASFSQPIGVRVLDTRICDVLEGDKQDYLTEINADPDQGRIDRFHRMIYDNLRPYNAGKYGIIGQGKELSRIHDCIRGFADEIAEYAEQFLEREQYQRIDTLILTGGGCNIPIVRDTLCKRLDRYRKPSSFAGTYVPAESESRVPTGYHRLKPLLVRGATALGGASVFFDFAEGID